MKIRPIDLIYWILAFLPLAVTAAVFPAYPQTVPAHINMAGQIDRYGGRAELFLLPAVTLGIAAFFFVFFRAVDKLSDGANRKITGAAQLVVMATFNVLTYTMLVLDYNAAHARALPDICRILAVVLSLSDIAVAGYLPQGLAGIRTGRTLRSDDVRRAAHRFGARLMAAGGAVCAVVSLLLHGAACLYFILGAEIVMAVAMAVYPRLRYGKGEKTDG